MNLSDNIVEYLEKSNFDDFTKIRYVYLYVCNIFSYDVRFMYALPTLKDKIYNKKVDITNVEDFEIVCYTCSQILVDILSLLNFSAEVVRVPGQYFQHTYVIVKYKDKLLKLDPTKRHDITRVKIGSSTLSFESLSEDSTFYEQLNEADNNIARLNDNKKFLSSFYNIESSSQLLNIIKINSDRKKLSAEEFFFAKLKAIICLVNTRTDLNRYDDISYYLSYLIKKFEMNSSQILIRPAVFFKLNDNEMKDLINIIIVEYRNLLPSFYILEKVGNNFKIRPIEAKEVLNKLDEYSNWQVNYYFSNKAQEAIARKI